MAYASYADYIGTYHGTAIAEADFARLAQRASEVIDQVTFERAAPVVADETDTATIAKIALATCAVAEEIQAQEAGGGQTIQSERLGNWSVTYATQKSNGARQADAARRYLGNTALLYRGLNADER